MVRIAAVLLMSVVMGGAYGQPAPAQPSLADVLAGNVYPLTLKLKDLDGTWRRMSAGQDTGTSSYMRMISAAMSGGQGEAYYTTGKTVTIAGESYMIAYRTASRPISYSMLRSGTPPKPVALTPEDTLYLGLLNIKTLGNLTDIRPFDLKAETTMPVPEPPDPATLATESTSNMKQIGLALQMYTQDYDEVLPPMKDAKKAQMALMPYIRSAKIFTSPVTGEPYQPNVILSNKKLKHIADPASFVAFYETKTGPDGKRGVVCLDGHAARVPGDKWEVLKKASKIR